MIKLPRGESCGEVVKFWRKMAYNDSVETSFQELRQKQVINLCDGKQLGKTSDVVFTYPEGRVQGIVVPGRKGFRWGRAELYIDLKCIKKIGVDVVLVDIRSSPKQEPKNKWGVPRDERRDLGDYE